MSMQPSWAHIVTPAFNVRMRLLTTADVEIIEHTLARIKKTLPQPKPMIATTITVTQWTHPTWDQTLILEGNTQSTLDTAKGHLADDADHSTLLGKEEQMDVAQFRCIPEFSG